MPSSVVESEKQVKGAVQVESFAIEGDHPRNGDLILQGIVGARLRSRITASRTVTDVATGEPLIPPDQAAYLGQFPTVPGMQLHVSPAKLTYTILDPLESDEDMCERIKKALDRMGPYHTDAKVHGCPPQKGELDVNRMKTLVREMVWLVDSGHARVVKGAKPAMADVDRMPGRYLLNPGSTIQNTQPRFEDQFDAWVEKINSQGG